MNKLLLIALLAWSAVVADERILDFHSDIRIMEDGWIEVTEHITVRAEGKRIRRGIYRDFPTVYEDRHGNRHVVDFDPQALLRNDQPEDMHSDNFYNGVRVYFGAASRLLDPGIHRYTFRYRASRMLGFFADHDELYWNVTGLDWAFPIDKAGASVYFQFSPEPAEISVEAYTGPAGATGQNYTARVEGQARAEFATTRGLPPHHGLTIVTGWPKGYVEEPSAARRVAWLIEDNAGLVTGLVGILLLLAYYIPVWRHFGKDPQEGVLVTRYEPPDGYSPASLRYIRQMYYDNKTMTAAVVNLAVKGYLRINATIHRSGFFSFGSKDNKHSLTRIDASGTGPDPRPVLAAGEAELYEALFRDGDTIILETENHETLGEARSAHKRSLQADYRNKYFRKNLLLSVPAILIVIVTAVIALSSGGGPGLATIVTVIVMFLIAAFFAAIMKRPTMRGRKLLDELAGFRDYLEVAEKDELNLRNPPEKTPELFEAYLPFALALGVDQLWAEKFAGVLAGAAEPGTAPYSPAWYNGTWNVSNLTASTGHLSGSLNSAISSSVTPPGSSSGGGGGGSSGGGGGGGGGGGW